MKIITRAFLASSAMALMLAPSIAMAELNSNEQQALRDSLIQSGVPGVESIMTAVRNSNTDLGGLQSFLSSRGVPPIAAHNAIMKAVAAPPPITVPLAEVKASKTDLDLLQEALDKGEFDKAATLITKLTPAQLASVKTNSKIKGALSKALKSSKNAEKLAGAIEKKTKSNPDLATTFASFTTNLGNKTLAQKVGTVLANTVKTLQNQKNGANASKLAEIAKDIEAIEKAIGTNKTMQTAYNTTIDNGSLGTDNEGSAAIPDNNLVDQQTDPESTDTIQQVAINNAVTGNAGQTTLTTTPVAPGSANTRSPN